MLALSKQNRALWELTRGQRGRYLGALAALALGTGLALLVPLQGKTAIDAITAGSGRPLPVLLRAAAAMVALAALSGLLVYLRGWLSAGAAEDISRRLRDRLFDRIQRMRASELDRADSGDLVQRATSDVETLRTFLASQLVEVGRALLLLVLVVPMLLRLDLGMTLVGLCLFPFIIGSALVFFRRVQGSFLATDEAEARMTTTLHENLTGVRVVRAFGREDHERARFAARNRDYRDRWSLLVARLGDFWAVSDLMCAGQIGLVALVAAMRLREGSIGAGTVFAFLSYSYTLMEPLRHVGRTLAEMGKAVVAMRRIEEVLETAVEEDGAGAAAPVEPAAGRIAVRGVSFAYGVQRVLERVSFELERGQTLALVGPPGAGKSTLAHLLIRLYEPAEGSIELDGRDLRTLPRRWLREQVGCVLQEPFLFSRSLRDNLLFARPTARDEEIHAATEAACVHDAITGFEHGYQTLVGERGVTLSGGQRQRVALARALLQDPAVLILDDALSAVDTETEARLLEALRARRGRRTTVVIAHRLSTLAHADRVLVLEAGRVVQEGAPAELRRSQGPFRRLWQLQTALEREIESDIANAKQPRQVARPTASAGKECA